MKSVVICGSLKFKEKIRKFAQGLGEYGVEVYSPHLYENFDGELGSEEYALIAEGLTYGHFQKIRIADIVFIYNGLFEDPITKEMSPYIGTSTTLEIGFAAALNKPIYVLHKGDTDICRQILFIGKAEYPSQLAKIAGSTRT